MAFQLKPSWLLDASRLKDIAQHYLFLPQDLPQITSLQDPSAFLSGLKSFLFWKGQISPSLQPGMVFLALLGPQGLKLPDAINITLALQDIVDLSQLAEFYKGADTHFLALSFTSKESVTQILSKFLYYDDSIVLAVTFNDVPQHRFRLLWLPPLFDIARVSHMLNQHSLSHRLHRESIPIAGGKFTPTNVVSGFLTLKPGIDAASLPHLIQLPSPHKGCALLTIEDRPPLCLKCRAVGHTRQKCNMVKCSKCLKVHFPSSSCGTSSYSSVASRNITSTTDDDWLKRLCDDDTSLLQVSDLNLLQASTNTSTSLPPVPVNAPVPIASTSLPLTLNSSPCHAISSNCDSECDHTLAVLPSSSTLPLKPNDIDSHLDVPLAIPPLKSSSSANLLPLTCLPESSDSSSADNSSLASPSHMQSATTKINLTHRKESAKVHISEYPSLLSSTARSQIIPYSVAPSVPIATYSAKVLVAGSASPGLIFGDPDPENTFSSDSDPGSDLPTTMDTSDQFSVDPFSRKRKGSDLFSDRFLPDSDSSPSSPIAPITSSGTSLATLDNSSLPDVNTILDFANPSSQHSPLHQQVSCLFGAEDSQIDILEGLCPNGSFTPELIKTFKLLFTQGFGLDSIISFPQILIIRLTELKKKLKYLEKHQGSFTLEDVWHQGRIEARANFVPPPTGPQHPF